jgi:hypothetical protein
MDETCFVIQPFDQGKYDELYRDIFAPAINDAGLKPYRVDNDPSATVLIDKIECSSTRLRPKFGTFPFASQR